MTSCSPPNVFLVALLFCALFPSWCTPFELASHHRSPYFSPRSTNPLSARVSIVSQPTIARSSRTTSAFVLKNQRDDCNSGTDGNSVKFETDIEILHKNEPSSSTLRRRLLLSASTLASSTLLPNNANAAETVAESIRVISSKTIPGLGPPDVYYPPYFAGKWRVTRIITSSEDSLWQGINLPVKIVHEMRFVPYNAYTTTDNSSSNGSDESNNNSNANNVPAIADRTFNERSYHATFSSSAPKTLPPVQSLDWTPSNPNVLSISYVDGSSKEIKVTKRSSDVAKDGSSVFSSEFRRVTVVPAVAPGSVGGGIPSIYGSRLLSKWKQAAVSNDDNGRVDLIEGIEILYNEQGRLGERDGKESLRPMLYGGDSKDLADWRSTKTKILMERIVG